LGQVVQLYPGANPGRTRRERAGDRGDHCLLGQGQHPRVVSTGTSPLPGAAAVSASVAVYRKAASRPGPSVMPQPYAAPPSFRRPLPAAITKAGSAVCTRVHEQRQSGVPIGHDHDVIAAVVRWRSATSKTGTGVHDTSGS
jgi:hypothetical protein